MFKRVFSLFILMWTACTGFECLATENISVFYDLPIRLDLSKSHINRIYFAGKPIKKIVGNIDEYEIILSDNRKDMFLQLKGRKDKIVNISVIDFADKIWDLEITPIESKYPTLVRLEDDNMTSKAKKDDEQQEAEQMISAMQLGIADKYYVTGGGVFNCAIEGEANCRVIANYRYGKYRAIGIRVENIGKNNLLLDANDFTGIFPYKHKLIMQKPDSYILPTNAKGTIYLVGKQVDNV